MKHTLWCASFFAILDAFASRIYDCQAIPLPTERSEGGRERGERCQWQMKRPERVAAVDKIEEKRKPEDFIGHRNR